LRFEKLFLIAGLLVLDLYQFLSILRSITKNTAAGVLEEMEVVAMEAAAMEVAKEEVAAIEVAKEEVVALEVAKEAGNSNSMPPGRGHTIRENKQVIQIVLYFQVHVFSEGQKFDLKLPLGFDIWHIFVVNSKF
jgi:hypothetical protein